MSRLGQIALRFAMSQSDRWIASPPCDHYRGEVKGEAREYVGIPEFRPSESPTLYPTVVYLLF